MLETQKILVTGIKPTGTPHIGNYFGMMKQTAELSCMEEYRSLIFIADLHALTTLHDSHALSVNIKSIVLDYLAIGIDPDKTTIFLQSDIPEIAELCWIFNCITTMPYLMRAHAFKDAEAKNKDINVGTFDYPLLMAADILIQNADVVPVGQDQKQHVEIARDTAEKFNLTFGETFKPPTPIILEEVKTIHGTDGRKMSKSYGNTISLFATDEEIRKAVMSIPTDSKGIDEPKDIKTDNVFALHKLFASGDELGGIEKRYREGNIGYKESKDILIGNISRFAAPLRERRKEFEAHDGLAKEILRNGGKIAEERARAKMHEVRGKIGLIPL